MNDSTRQLVTAAATIAVIVVNALANALPINGQGTGEISDRIDVYFTPAGYVFSIWGLIYVGLIAFTIFQALPAQRQDPAQRAVAPFYWLSCAANIVWILLWHYEFFALSVAVMLVLLFSLIAVYVTLDVGRTAASGAQRWFTHLPFSIYLGWITVATIANITAALWIANWSGFGISPEAWTAIMLAVAVVVATVVAWTRGDAGYALVLTWAFAGIYIKHASVPIVGTSALTAAVAVAILALLSLWPGGPLPRR